MHFTKIHEELEQYYSSFDTGLEKLMPLLKGCIESHPEDSSYMRKTRVIELFCRECAVHLFRSLPFFFEMSSGRGRYTWGGLQSPAGTYSLDITAEKWLTPYAEALEKDIEEGFFFGWAPVGTDHHCPGYDNLLTLGLNGIIGKAERALETCEDPRKREFYTCVIRCNRALLGLAQRFAAEAERLAQTAASGEERDHYLKIANAAKHTPAEPPRTFYEALSAILFYRECVGSVEGLGMSTFGHLDRMLYPYYQADLSAGRITPEEAHQLFCDLLLYTKVRFRTDSEFHETSTTIQLGGCDRDGNVIYNALTDMILQAAIDTRSLNTKLNCRISRKHPDEYLQKIMSVQLANLPCVMMQNDDVLIPAKVRQGQAVEDARLYVGGGCHEIVLANTEVCTRADTWINLPRLFLETIRTQQNISTFEELYQTFLDDVQVYYNKIVALKNAGEAHWCEYAPTPLYSSSITGSLESGRDVTEGGAKYNTTALSLVAPGTVIDSLYSVKQLVFDENKLTLPEFVQILDENFENNEALRQYILHKVPKHGTNDETLNGFSARFLEDLSRVAGQTNARGGKYMPAFYAHNIYQNLGKRTGATPDGRLGEMPLSRGISPSEFVQTDSPLDIIHSIKYIDFTRYAESFVTDITLPNLENNEKSSRILVAIIRAFLEAEGSSLQFNLLSREMLQDARRNPQQHRNLMVRVCGFSALYVALNEAIQEEILHRAIR